MHTHLKKVMEIISQPVKNNPECLKRIQKEILQMKNIIIEIEN